ncbi:MAG: hypothetical protein JSV50_11295, partial [Desulfobacteraceae bacterium]
GIAAVNEQTAKQGGGGGRTVSEKLPISSRPHRGALFEVDTTCQVPADTRGFANLCARLARGREMGPRPSHRSCCIHFRTG